MGSSAESLYFLSGTQPGILDPSQPARLLRNPKSTLVFASFDPRTALPLSSLDSRSTATSHPSISYSSRRVVLELLPSGPATWRFVPRARRDPSVANEGSWPRVIDLCGTQVLCSQDQWDIYKLDPAYECLVRAHPDHSTITRVPDNPPYSASTPSSLLGVKRRRSLSPDELEDSRRKRLHSTASPADEDLGQETENNMDVDVSPPASQNTQRKNSKPKNGLDNQGRRERTAHRVESLSSQPSETVEPGKRKGYPVSDATDPDHPLHSQNHIPTSHGQKRMRTLSPDSTKRTLQTLRSKRVRRKEAQREGRRNLYSNSFMDEVVSSMPTPEESDSDAESEPEPEPAAGSPFEGQHTDEPEDEDAARKAFIEESRRKMAELERDRPLWEAAAKTREEREKQEEQAQKEAAARRRAEAAAQQQAKARQAEEARQNEEEAQQRKEDFVRREREKHRREQRQWTSGRIWTASTALARYRQLSDYFDATKFCVEIPLTFEAVPWPVLQSPTSVSIEDIDWTAVELFFSTVKTLMSSQDYKVFIEKAHRRMHPDRWRSRGLLKSVLDSEERNCLEVAANTVAQAITPIWSDLKQLA